MYVESLQQTAQYLQASMEALMKEAANDRAFFDRRMAEDGKSAAEKRAMQISYNEGLKAAAEQMQQLRALLQQNRTEMARASDEMNGACQGQGDPD